MQRCQPHTSPPSDDSGKATFWDAVSEYVGGLEPKKAGLTARGLRRLGGRGEEEKVVRRGEQGLRYLKDSEVGKLRSAVNAQTK